MQDIQSHAERLAAAAPPLTVDQLDALGQIVRSVPPQPPAAVKPGRRRQRLPRQLAPPYNQVVARPARVVLHGRKVIRRQRLRDVEEHPAAETGRSGDSARSSL